MPSSYVFYICKLTYGLHESIYVADPSAHSCISEISELQKFFYHSSTIAVEKGNNLFCSLFFFPSEKMRDIGGVQS